MPAGELGADRVEQPLQVVGSQGRACSLSTVARPLSSTTMVALRTSPAVGTPTSARPSPCSSASSRSDPPAGSRPTSVPAAPRSRRARTTLTPLPPAVTSARRGRETVPTVSSATHRVRSKHRFGLTTSTVARSSGTVSGTRRGAGVAYPLAWMTTLPSDADRTGDGGDRMTAAPPPARPPAGPRHAAPAAAHQRRRRVHPGRGHRPPGELPGAVRPRPVRGADSARWSSPSSS